jgi:hypothetical protein
MAAAMIIAQQLGDHNNRPSKRIPPSVQFGHAAL